MSTGNIRPGIIKMLASSKYFENFSASSVALLMISFKSVRKRTISFTNPNNISVWSVRSWASSITMQEYEARSGSVRISRSSIPSVMYCITVLGLVQFSNRIEYPTSCPMRTFISCATRAATLIAATRRGCVQPILPRSLYPISCRYCGIWVVFPEPVSPTRIKTWWSLTAAKNSSR